MQPDLTRHLNIGGKVVAALDLSSYTASVARYAAWSAARLDAPLELTHVLDPEEVRRSLNTFEAAGGEDENDAFAEDLIAVDEAQAIDGRKAAQGLLNRAKVLVERDHDCQADTRLREGGLAQCLTAMQQDVRLFVMGKRGEYADFYSGPIGSQLERVVRGVYRPLLITIRRFTEPRRVLIAFDGSPTTRKGVEMVAASPLFRGSELTVLMVGEDSGERATHMDWALQTLREHGHTAQRLFRRGPVDAVISREAQSANTDLLVMGAYGHSRIRSFIVGSTTTHVLKASDVPVLLLR